MDRGVCILSNPVSPDSITTLIAKGIINFPSTVSESISYYLATNVSLEYDVPLEMTLVLLSICKDQFKIIFRVRFRLCVTAGSLISVFSTDFHLLAAVARWRCVCSA